MCMHSDLMSFITFMFEASRRRLSSLGTGFSPGIMLAGSAEHFPANLAFGLPARCTTPAPLTVFCSVDHMGMRYRHRLRINVEI